MSLEIISRTVNSETDNRLQVTGHAVGRTINASSWTTLRFGFRWSTSRTTSWVGPPALFIGLSSGKSAMPGSATPNHFLGFKPQSNWGSTGLNDMYVATSWGGCRIAQIQSGTETLYTVSGGSDPVYLGRNLLARGIVVMEFTKGSPWTVKLYTANHVANITLAQFRAAMDTGAGSVPANTTLRFTGTRTVDEATYGNLDTICFSWLGTSENFELSDLDYKVLS